MTLKHLSVWLILCSITLFPKNIYGQDSGNVYHFLKIPILWKTDYKHKNIQIKSEQQINMDKVDYIFEVYNETKQKFYEFNKKTHCTEENFELRIISFDEINSNQYFTQSNLKEGYTYYGRYFSSNNIIYITPSAFDKDTKNDLIHELAHYFQDMCQLKITETGVDNFLKHIDGAE